MPQVYIYDNTDGTLTGREADIHIKVWSGCYIPLFIIIEEKQVRIFDARKRVAIEGDQLRSDPIETIVIAAGLVQQFSARDFDTGMFWEAESSNTSNNHEYVYGERGGMERFKKEHQLISLS